MKKNELKMWMRVLYNNGEIAIVVNVYNEIILISQMGIIPLNDYSDTLYCNSDNSRELDIMKVYAQPSKSLVLDYDKKGDLLWNRNNVEKLTIEEVCEQLGKEVEIITKH